MFYYVRHTLQTYRNYVYYVLYLMILLLNSVKVRLIDIKNAKLFLYSVFN